MSSFVDAYDPAWDQLFAVLDQAEKSKPNPERKLSEIGPVSSKFLHEYGLTFSVIASGGVRSARGLYGLLFRVVEDEGREFLCSDTFQMYRGHDALCERARHWATGWKHAQTSATRFTYHIRLRYPLDADPYSVSVAAQNFACELTGGGFGGCYEFILVHHHDTKRMRSDLIINRVPRSGNLFHISRFAITPDHLRRLLFVACCESGAITDPAGPDGLDNGTATAP